MGVITYIENSVYKHVHLHIYCQSIKSTKIISELIRLKFYIESAIYVNFSICCVVLPCMEKNEIIALSFRVSHPVIAEFQYERLCSLDILKNSKKL